MQPLASVFTRFLASLVAASLAMPMAAAAQIFDHLKCYEVEDAAEFIAEASLLPLQQQFPSETAG